MTRVRAAFAITALLLAGLAGCTTAPGPAPDGVSALIYQPRLDVADDRMVIQVRNDTGVPLRLTSARLTSTTFAEAAIWSKDAATVAPGFALDLRVEIPRTVCGRDEEPVAAVEFGYTLGESSGTARVRPDDPHGLLARLRHEACVRASVEAVARIELADLLSPGEPGLPAHLVFAIEPTGAAGVVMLVAVSSTTLLAPFDGVTGTSLLPLGIELSAQGPIELRLPFVPNRCDRHALAEDKVGTRIPLYVTTAAYGEERLVVAASDELRGRLWAFWTQFCGF